MKTIREIASAQPLPPPTANSAVSVVEWGILLTAAIAGIGTLTKWAMTQFTSAQKNESEMMRSWATFNQEVQGRLIQDSKEAKLQLIEHINLKDAINRTNTLMKDELARAMSSQTAIYVEGLKNQTNIENKIDSLHRRQDETDKVLACILEALKNEGTR